MSYQTIIGLEIHIELNTKTKMFCSCRNDSNEKRPNLNICPICLGHPGTLPMINKEAVRKTIKTGLALNSQIEENSFFERKNYFYPDLPKGYQISQYQKPLCKNGFLKLQGKKFRIRRIHLEEDTARLIHERNCSLVDFNRAGIPLMELVTEPDFSSAKEARKFAEELHLIMHYLNVSDADMEKGQMRVEVNVSLVKTNKTGLNPRQLGTKVEIKNLNSFKSIEQALEYETERQKRILKLGKKVIQETRGWDENKGATVSQREKEEAHDYRYFPEPDLPPLHITSEILNEIRAELPELPAQRRERFKKEYQLDKGVVEFFVYNKNLGEFFEKAVSELNKRVKKVIGKEEVKKEEIFKLSKLCSNYIVSDLQGLLKKVLVLSRDFLITPKDFADFVFLIYEGKISSKIAKIVLEEMLKSGDDPFRIVEKKRLVQITDEKQIVSIVKEIISQNQNAVLDFKKGKLNALQFLIGQTMAKTKSKANPEIVRKILKELLG